MRVVLTKYLLFLQIAEQQVEIHIGKYPLFGKEEKRSFEKLKELVYKICDRIKISKSSLTLTDFMKKILAIEQKWIEWKNKKAVDPIFKQPRVELKKSIFTRKFQRIRWS